MRLCLGLLLLAWLVVPMGVGCNGGGGGGVVVSPVATFDASGTPAAPDLVRLDGVAIGDMVVLTAVIGGPSTSSDLYSLDLLLRLSDPTLVQYIPQSAIFGDAFTLSGVQTGAALAAQNGAFVTVGATKAGGGAGNGVAAGEHVIVQLTFRVLRRGTTTISIVGAPDASPAVLDSTGATVASVHFDLASASISGI